MATVARNDRYSGTIIPNMSDSSTAPVYTLEMENARAALAEFLGIDDLSRAVWLSTKGEDMDQFRLDVRCDVYGKLLIVNPVTESDPPPDIYVLAKPTGADLAARLIGWQFAKRIRREPIMHGGFPGRSGHTVPVSQLRSMDELTRRLVGVVE